MAALYRFLAVLFAFALWGCASNMPQAKAARDRRAVPSHAPGIKAEQVMTMSNSAVDRDEADVEGAPVPEPTPAEAPPVPVAMHQQPGASPAPAGGQPPPRSPIATDGVQSGQMLVYTATLTMAVYQVEQGLAVVERAAREFGGYLAARTDRMVTIGVPRARFEAALKMIEPSGDVVHREIKAEDVTDEFFDVEVRVRNARAMRDRLAKLLQQAAVKEALEIEKELARVTEEIERLEGKLKLLRHRVAYSTITVTFQPRGTAVQTRPLRLPFPWLQQLGLPSLLQLNEDG